MTAYGSGVVDPRGLGHVPGELDRLQANLTYTHDSDSFRRWAGETWKLALAFDRGGKRTGDDYRALLDEASAAYTTPPPADEEARATLRWLAQGWLDVLRALHDELADDASGGGLGVSDAERQQLER